MAKPLEESAVAAVMSRPDKGICVNASRLLALLVSSSLLFAPVAVAATGIVNPQQTVKFPTWWIGSTGWRVYNPHPAGVEVHVACGGSYGFWFWVSGHGYMEGGWSCGAAPLEFFNNAQPASGYWLDVVTW